MLWNICRKSLGSIAIYSNLCYNTNENEFKPSPIEFINPLYSSRPVSGRFSFYYSTAVCGTQYPYKKKIAGQQSYPAQKGKRLPYENKW